ncbi:MAG: hypothetical protein FD159_1698 [Syntrophaceae bacterium]|nr:MAG: hypothetical protein FD159_1698 [Syntrophaceae bacterium]
MSSLATTGFVVFILILFIGIYLTLFRLPGTVIIFLDVLLYAFFTGFAQVGWKVLLFLFVFSILAESLDFLPGLTQAHKAPVIKKSLWGAAIGAAVGMIIFTPLFWGLGIWGGFFLGGLAGLLIMELFRQSRLRGPHQVSNRAFFAMIGQRVVKGFFALIMIFVSLSNIYS